MDYTEDILQTFYVTNPFGRDFTHPFDSRPVTIPAKATVPMAKPLALHMAREIVNQMIIEREPGTPEENFTRILNDDVRAKYLGEILDQDGEKAQRPDMDIRSEGQKILDRSLELSSDLSVSEVKDEEEVLTNEQRARIEELNDMSKDELQSLAKERGIYQDSMKKKSDLIEALIRQEYSV